MASWEEFSRIVAEAKAAKKLDPVGKEDDDINNDDKVDSTDDYLKNKRSAVGAAIAADKKKKSGKDSDEMCEAKVDEKLPEHERATARDKRSGHNLPGSGTRRVRRAEHEDRRGKPKRWWDDDGDGIGWEKGEVKKEEVERIDEIAPLVVGGIAAAAAAPYLAKKFLSKPINKALDNATKTNKLPLATGGNMQQLRQAQNNSYQPEGEMVEEDKEYRREMAKAAARERAEERREKGSKAAKSPGREGPSAGKSYADYQEISIKAHDKLTKKNKNPIGLVAKEESEYIEEKGMSKDEMSSVLKGHRYSKQELLNMSKKSTKEGRHGEAAAFYHEFQKEEIERLDEMPYQVYGSPDGKKESKIGKPVKSRKYAHGRAEELADTHKETGGKYRVQKEESELQEKALSRAQQRFMGMVYAAKKGETPASPEVAKAASGMSKKAARDFAKTKHEGLPEKKEETKEELSLVDRMIAEAIAGTIAGGKSRAKKYKVQAKDVRIKQIGSAALSGDEEEINRLKKSNKNPTKKITKKGSVESEKTPEPPETPETPETDKTPKTKKDPKRSSAYVKYLNRKLNYQKRKDLEKKEKERRSAEEAKKKAKEQHKRTLKHDIAAAWSTPTKMGNAKTDTSDMSATVSNVGGIVGSVAKTGVALAKYALKKRKARKEDQKQKKEESTQKEEFSNWREEFIFEVDDQSVQNEKQKVIDVSKKKNKIEINPNMSEGCGCDEKEKTEKPQKDMRDLPTKINLAKTKARSMGAKNPIVMVATEGAAWTKKEGKSEAGGLNEKGRKSYERENPGSDLKAPSKKVGNPRRASFCARMSGMKAKLTSKKTANDPDSRINKSLRAWNC